MGNKILILFKKAFFMRLGLTARAFYFSSYACENTAKTIFIVPQKTQPSHSKKIKVSNKTNLQPFL